MNSGYEIIRNNIKRKTEKRNVEKIGLNLSKIKPSKFKYSISPRTIKKNDNNKNLQININIKKPNYLYSNKNLNRHKLIQNHLSIKSFAFNNNTKNNPFRKPIEDKKIDTKRYSLKLIKTLAKKLYQKYNLKINR